MQEAIVLLLDVGKTMSKSGNQDKTSNLEAAVEVLTLLVQQKVMNFF